MNPEHRGWTFDMTLLKDVETIVKITGGFPAESSPAKGHVLVYYKDGTVQDIPSNSASFSWLIKKLGFVKEIGVGYVKPKDVGCPHCEHCKGVEK